MTVVKPSDEPAPQELIKETTTQAFVKDVVEESKRQPVLIDFWAPWCGPCRHLTPALEKAVRAAKGRVKLVKMNIDEYPEIPGQLGIQSIPAVIAFVNGQPVDGFMGAIPERQIDSFIERLFKMPVTDLSNHEEAPDDHSGTAERGNTANGETGKNLPKTAGNFIFISHVAKDRPVALDIVGRLERHGLRCWIAPRNVRPGRPFDDEIVAAIETCQLLLLVFSDQCNDSDYIRREVTVAGEVRKLIIPFRIENAQPRKGLRVRLADLHWIDAFHDRNAAIDELILSLESVDTMQ